MRLEVTTCDGLFTGSGFLVAPDLVATVAHVVEDHATIAVRGEHGVTRGELVGMDAEHEVALVRLVHALDGHVFTFAPQDPQEGTAVAVIGYPEGRPLSSTKGTVSALHRRIDFEQSILEDLVQYDAAANHGNSGGPVIRRNGTVIGLTEAGADGNDINYAVSAATAAPLVAGWRSQPEPVAAAGCPAPTADVVTMTSRHPDAPGIAWTFASYFGGITEGDDATRWGGYDWAWEQLSGSLRGRYASFDDFVQKQSTSVIEGATIDEIRLVDPLSDQAEVRFRSYQDAEHGPSGQTCSQWHLRYTVRIDSGSWTIEDAESIEPPVPCE